MKPMGLFAPLYWISLLRNQQRLKEAAVRESKFFSWVH
jgi:hypothetical protein